MFPSCGFSRMLTLALRNSSMLLAMGSKIRPIRSHAAPQAAVVQNHQWDEAGIPRMRSTVNGMITLPAGSGPCSGTTVDGGISRRAAVASRLIS